MHRHVYPVGTAIVDGVTGPAAERDTGYQRVVCGVDHRVGISVFVRNKNTLNSWGVGQTVGVLNVPDPRQRFERRLIDDRDLMIPGDGRKDSVQFGHREDAMDAMKSLKIGDHLAFSGIENNQLVCIHMRDKEAAIGNVQDSDNQTGRRGREGEHRRQCAGHRAFPRVSKKEKRRRGPPKNWLQGRRSQ